jgi:hypothetical protein
MADSTKSGSATITLQPATSGTFALRVNAGGGAYTDSQGNVWSIDTGYSGGSGYTTTRAISNTTTPALYQTERWNPGLLRYQFSVPAGSYNVTLKFAEIYFSSTGMRKFNVSINGQSVLSNFDIVAAAGGALRAIDRQFSVSALNGVITIDFIPVVENPKISAIEIKAP